MIKGYRTRRIMNKKITVLVLMLASLVIFLPSQGNAATSETTTLVKTTETNAAPAQVRVQIGQNRRRNNRRINRRIIRREVRRNNRPRVRQQVYYRNGRRYVRTVRVY